MSDKREFSWSVIFIWAGLFTFGLTAIFSATQGEGAEFLPSYIQNNFYRQFMWVAISAVALGVIQFISPRTFQEWAYLFYAIFLLLIVILLFFGSVVSCYNSCL